MRLALTVAITGTGAGFSAWGLADYATAHRPADLTLAVTGFLLALGAAVITATLIARR